MNLRISAITCLVILVIAACNRPECISHNAIFIENTPHNNLYKAELLRLIDSFDKNAFDYYVSGYTTEQEIEYLEAYIQNDEVCAILPLDITGSEQLAQFRRVEGKGYSGAGLYELDYDIIREDSSVSFLFKGVGRIVD